MDNINKSKQPMSLAQILMSYNVLIVSLLFFVFFIILLLVLNPKGFNKMLGYELLIAGPVLLIVSMLIKEIYAFKINPQSSWLSKLSMSSSNGFIGFMILVTISISLIGLFYTLFVGGLFSDNPPEYYIQTVVNLLVILILVSILITVYLRSKRKDDVVLNSMSNATRDFFTQRTKYTVIFIGYCLLIGLLYFFNPFGLMTKYGGPVLFTSLFIGMVLVSLITIYQTKLTNNSNNDKDIPGFIGFFVKGSYILISLAITLFLIYFGLKHIGMFNQDASNPSTWGPFIFNFFVFMGMLGVIYKLANAGGFLDKSPYYRLILNVIFYIPCFVLYIFTNLTTIAGLSSQPSEIFAKPTPFEIKMLILSLTLFVSYFGIKQYLVSKYLKQGGQQLVNNPLPTNKLTNIGNYETFSMNDKHNYQYAVSFWTYLDAFPPTSTNKFVPIFSYGENPCVKYNSIDNTLYVTVKEYEGKMNKEFDLEKMKIWEKEKEKNKEKDNLTDSIENVKLMRFKNDLDGNGDVILYKEPNVKLQKWNHMVLNYSGGTLDVFYNGKLVKSAIEIVPYMNFNLMSIGCENGASGHIANVMYFNEPLDILTVNTLYSSLKNKNPPTI